MGVCRFGAVPSREAALAPGGVVVIKDNFFWEDDEDGHDFIVDRDDSSIIRSPRYMRALFRAAGCAVVADTVQERFPDEVGFRHRDVARQDILRLSSPLRETATRFLGKLYPVRMVALE